MKSYLIIITQRPYASSCSSEAVEFALALAAFYQTVNLAFIDAGVLHLMPDQNTALINQKNYTSAYGGLDLFGINSTYIEHSSAKHYGIETLLPQSQQNFIDQEKLEALIAQHDYVLTI